MPDRDEAPTDNVTGWRLSQLENRLDRLETTLKEAVNQVGGGLTALQTQLAALQVSLADHFTPRTEAQTWREATTKRLERLESDAKEQRDLNWRLIGVVVSGLIAAILALAQTIFRFIPGTHP